MTNTCTIGVVGNPNCGKTTLFNALTGAKQRVGNWPGVTVERKTGRYSSGGINYVLVDLPGTYSLDVADEGVSLDEKIARDYVASGEADLIVNIVDASNLERNLYLTSQLLEMKVPMLVALNMMDAAEEAGMNIDLKILEARLGCPVLAIVAARHKGLEALNQAIRHSADSRSVPDVTIRYAEPLEKAVTTLLPRIAEAARKHHVDPRWLALRLLEGDGLAQQIAGTDAGADLAAMRKEVEDDLGDDIDISLADTRYGWVNALTAAAVTRRGRVSRNLSDRIDRVVLNRALGVPIFLVAMHLMFMFTINIGGAFIDAFDIVTGAITVDGFGALLAALGAPEWLIVLLADGVGGGIQVVATFIPVVGFLFLFLSFLEDSGYMARAAFVMDRFLRSIGLPGKSFVPMIVGFGCTVPAVMATRTLESERDRKITIAMAPFMSCGARLPVYALFAAAFFAAWAQYVVFALYLTGIAVSVLTGLVLKHTLLRGEVTPFVMELPPYHLPTFKGVMLRTWERTKGFVIRAGRVIVPMVLVLNVLNTIGSDGSYGNEDSDKSLLSEIGRTISPLFAPFGLNEENWPASVGIFTGLLAKEAVVGTLDSLYSELGEAQPPAAEPALRSQDGTSPLSWRADMTEEALPAPAADESLDLLGTIGEGLATVPTNLADALGSWLDPLGLNIGDVSDEAVAAEEQDVHEGTFGAMAARFDGGVGAFAYLLFILLYMPCVAAIAAVRRESSLRWTIFVTGWTTGTAYVVATLFYQVARFSAHPASSAAWIAGCVVLIAGCILAMRAWGSRTGRGMAGTAVAQS
ncbi:MAG: Fe(2+) transporter permease subunit FeoB [Paenirhodobacter sp.]|uniref:Fe(2+) transporter permease subunit FeoB n=1 Tax=Paenirhodobacter sp. TaxID=1965326 RepID=UPI003D13C61E